MKRTPKIRPPRAAPQDTKQTATTRFPLAMTAADKAWIDSASYEDLLRKNRFTPAGDPMFQGETGAYFQKVMGRKKEELRLAHPEPGRAIGDAASDVSKKVGWGD